LYIHGSSPRLPDTASSSGGRSTYDTDNNVRAGETRRAAAQVDAARATALSALRNDRFGTMLATISGPAASGALMTMTREEGTAGADFNSVLSSYAENGE